jgi:replication factor A1
VTRRPPKREYKNDRGPGTLFSVDLLDESGEIRATGFNETCAKFYDVLAEGRVFFIRGGKIKPANRKFSSVDHEYEVTLDNTTEIWEAPDDGATAALPQIKFNLVPLARLAEMPVEGNSGVDVLGVIVDVGALGSIIAKASRNEIAKRDLQLQDASACIISCTLWGDDAVRFEERGGAVGTVVAVKGARMSDYGGRSLSVSNASTLVVNPDTAEARELLHAHGLRDD